MIFPVSLLTSIIAGHGSVRPGRTTRWPEKTSMLEGMASSTVSTSTMVMKRPKERECDCLGEIGLGKKQTRKQRNRQLKRHAFEGGN